MLATCGNIPLLEQDYLQLVDVAQKQSKKILVNSFYIIKVLPVV